MLNSAPHYLTKHNVDAQAKLDNVDAQAKLEAGIFSCVSKLRRKENVSLLDAFRNKNGSKMSISLIDLFGINISHEFSKIELEHQ